MQNLPFFVGEWALKHNCPLLPLSRATGGVSIAQAEFLCCTTTVGLY